MESFRTFLRRKALPLSSNTYEGRLDGCERAREEKRAYNRARIRFAVMFCTADDDR